MNCPHCNAEVPSAAARCPACQSPLTPAPSLTGPAGVGLATGMGSGEAFALRFLAYLIDVILVSTVAGVISAILTAPLVVAHHLVNRGGPFGLADLDPSVQGIRSLVGLAVAATYGGLMLPRFGQTVGKMALGLRVSDALGSNPNIVQGALRESVCKWVSGLICALGYLWMLWDPQQQTWHDKMVGTQVVRGRGTGA